VRALRSTRSDCCTSTRRARNDSNTIELLSVTKAGISFTTLKQNGKTPNGSVKIRPAHRNCGFKNKKRIRGIDYFFDSERIVRREFILERNAVNGTFCQGILDCICKSITRFRPNL